MNYKLYKNDFPSTLNFKKMVAIDTETMGLNLNRDRLCLVQVCFGDDFAHLLQLSKQPEEKPKNLIKLLQNMMQNLKICHEYSSGACGATYGIP